MRGTASPQPPNERLSYTLPDAASATGLSVATLYRHAKAQRLRLFKVGGRTLVCATSLRALLNGGAMKEAA
jgi:hypothetical protein